VIKQKQVELTSKIGWYHIESSMNLLTVLRVAVVAAFAGTVASAAAQAPPPSVLTVFAASDLGPAFKQIVPLFERKALARITLVVGSTGVLAQQIRNGAPADVFFAANETFVTQLSSEQLTLKPSETVYARGRVAVVALRSGALKVDSLADLADARVRRIAIANPQHAPYGLAAKQALEAAGLWTAVEPKLVFGENVQQAVQFVRSGSAEAGIVARSVSDTPDLTWRLVDERLHAPLDQVAVVLARTKEPRAAAAFIEFVNSADGRVVMRQFGFLLPGESQ
jgi:molybdate transport system substrate-binding protein